MNSQIALELFLKYYFLRKDRINEIVKNRKGKTIFVDFEQILNNFYSKKRRHFTEKKILKKVLDSRNSIVHKGQSSNWDEELACCVASTFLFIHTTAWNELGESILFNNHVPHKICRNEAWKKAAHDLVFELATTYDVEILRCLGCRSLSALYGDIIALDDSNTEDDVICLSCLSSIDTSTRARLIECYNCLEKSYYIDS